LAFETYVYMVTSARSLPTAVAAILNRVYPLGSRMEGEFHEIGGERRRAVPEESDWAAKVDSWKKVHFAIANAGPLIGITLDKPSGTTLRACVDVSGKLLSQLFLDKRRHDPIFYAPLFQIALALGARAGVGDLELDEFKPVSEKEIEQAIQDSPLEPGTPSRLGFLRKDPSVPKPAGDFVVTERPEGYWLLEHPSFRRFLGEK
jgi:hypothetical protein